MSKTVPMTTEQEVIRKMLEELRLKLERVSVRVPESRAQMKAERKRLYQAINDLLQQLWGAVPYENLVAPHLAASLAKDIVRRLKIE